jgi:hypothetical protein
MRNVLRLETKGCRERVGGGGGKRGKRSSCLCDLPDKGGGEGEAMGNPRGNPGI